MARATPRLGWLLAIIGLCAGCARPGPEFATTLQVSRSTTPGKLAILAAVRPVDEASGSAGGFRILEITPGETRTESLRDPRSRETAYHFTVQASGSTDMPELDVRTRVQRQGKDIFVSDQTVIVQFGAEGAPTASAPAPGPEHP